MSGLLAFKRDSRSRSKRESPNSWTCSPGWATSRDLRKPFLSNLTADRSLCAWMTGWGFQARSWKTFFSFALNFECLFRFLISAFRMLFAEQRKKPHWKLRSDNVYFCFNESSWTKFCFVDKNAWEMNKIADWMHDKTLLECPHKGGRHIEQMWFNRKEIMNR